MSEPNHYLLSRENLAQLNEQLAAAFDRQAARIARLEGALRKIIDGDLLPSDAATARLVIATARAALDDKDTPRE